MVLLAKTTRRVRSVSARCRYYIFLLTAVFGSSLLFLSISNYTEIIISSLPTSSSWESHRYEIINSEERFTIKTEGCTIPALQPFDESVKKFSERPKHLKQCPNSNSSLLDNNETHIWINYDNLQYYDVPKEANITCCYRSFYRPSAIVDITAGDVDDRVQYQMCVDFTNHIEIDNEFIRVACCYEYKIVYEQFFLSAFRKPIAYYRKDSVESLQNQSAYNVLIIGIDAISRLNFYRTMPKTLAYLKNKSAVELFGYNKVGDNTFPNLTPMLLGIKDTELKQTCWPNSRATFDNCPFIWEWFKDAGYYTALGEDSASLGTFNFEKFGFSGTPTDYYLHTFMHEAEVHVGNTRDFNSLICMGNKYFYKVLLEYVENLASTLKSSRLFGFFWEVTMSHDYLNYPMLMDERYEEFLRKLDSFDYLEDTILILLSDHGIRWGDIRFTKQGRLEERLPFVHILVPQSFRDNYSVAYNNLKLNSRRLTTPFDIHATLSDLVNMDKISNEKLESRSKGMDSLSKSISLFLPIPRNRTCKIAGIDDHWCTCHKSSKLPVDCIESREAAAHLVRQLNNLLREHKQCSRLVLSAILEVTEMEVGTPTKNEVGWREFMVVVKTLPGEGVFEATIRRDVREWMLAGTISRLNLYGDQSRCVHHYQLKLYCYCR